jgi:hypothetical protein
MKIGIILLCLIWSLDGYAQESTKIIDMERIPQKKIRSLIADQFSSENLHGFNELQATYRKGQKLSGYHILESAYFLKEDPAKVFNTYLITSPAVSWNGSMVSFGVLVSKWENTVIYRNDKDFAGIDTGQVFYVNLKILKGLYNLAVGLEIVNIDTTNKSITFSYLKGGKSRGEQTLYFIPTRRGYTEIIHQTAFKSDSFLRDCYLYPYFHRIAINEFHRNMKRSLQGSGKMLAKQ